MVIVHSENTLCYRVMSLITWNSVDICFRFFFCMYVRVCVNFNETWFEKLVSLLFCSRHFDIEPTVLIKSLSCCSVQSMHICYSIPLLFWFLLFFLVSHSTQNSLTESVMSRENRIHRTMRLMTCCAFTRMNVHLLNGYSFRYIFHFLFLIGVYKLLALRRRIMSVERFFLIFRFFFNIQYRSGIRTCYWIERPLWLQRRPTSKF